MGIVNEACDSSAGHRPAAVVLFGPPGSGKGTQAKLLKQRLAVPHISTGDMLRGHVQAGDEIGRTVQAIMRDGSLVPDEFVNGLVAERVNQPDCRNGFILDGYPRTLQQARSVEEMLVARDLPQVVIHLKVDYNRIIARLNGRRQCPKCGRLYSLSSNPPKSPEICDEDGTRLVIREDDRESVIRQRLEEYERQTRPLLDYYARSGCEFHEVEASEGSPEQIVETICGLIFGK